jgi:hypothetical protein
MKRHLLAVLSIVLVVVAGLNAPASARTHVAASGDFVAVVDFSSLELRDAAHDNCVLTVNGTLEFSGTLVGRATGTTTALIFAPCADVAITPPGTYPDLFQFKGTFRGTVAGRPAITAELTYGGITRVGGAITAVITLRGDTFGVLRADAIVAQGGSYSGFVTA